MEKLWGQIMGLLRDLGAFLAGFMSSQLVQRTKDTNNAQERLEHDADVDALDGNDVFKRLQRWRTK